MTTRDLLLRIDTPCAVILVRFLVGGVFLSEGIQKFLFPEALGVERFTNIGIPAPGFTAPFVGVVEIVCGALLLLGLLTRVAAIQLFIDISVAIATTKIPLQNCSSSTRGVYVSSWRAKKDPERVLKIIRQHLQPDQIVFIGVIDPINSAVETTEQVCERILLAVKHLSSSQLGTTDDCGF